MKKQMRNGNFYLGLAMVMMVVLFISSAQTYEQQSQVGLLEKILHNQPFKASLSKISFDYAGSLVSIAHSGYFSFVEFFIRKGAHFATYFILGASWFLGFLPKTKLYLMTALVSWLAATGYAGLDEFHQMLTGGRTPLFQDVVLDSIGALTGVVIMLLIRYISKKK
ncbi:VanZ family protein [Enterococcus nangangensis]|uniref:VanZ family protein n=1 Tax=Enterococcus nangangensis TaxID=2559926 RepID=UPI0010F441A3|nr:VanZ family protein [Enterococcus nangangensis]